MTTTRVKINSIDDIPRMTKERAEEIKKISDEDIDYSDIPPIDDVSEFEFFKDSAELLERHSKQKKLISIRIEPSTLEALKEDAKKFKTNYQTLINQVLETFVHRSREK
jgi:predicted DNA binding CopG/RHH family protein